jgi:hypothetical protein
MMADEIHTYYCRECNEVYVSPCPGPYLCPQCGRACVDGARVKEPQQFIHTKIKDAIPFEERMQEQEDK